MSSSPFLRLWAWPLLLAVLSTSGLISALVSDTLGDAWSWFGLGLPVLVMGYFGMRRASSSSRTAVR